jgi:hypothetical protein
MGIVDFLPESISSFFQGDPVPPAVEPAAMGDALPSLDGLGAEATGQTAGLDAAASFAAFPGMYASNDKIDLAGMREGIADELAMQDARAALADKFDVDGAGTNQNVVSPEEFEKAAKLYSDIQRGKTDIKFDTTGMKKEDADKMKGLAMEDMAKMLQTDSGRAMLDGLAHNENDKGEHHTTTLSFIDDPTKSNCGRAYGADQEEQYRLQANDHNKVGNDSTIAYAPGKSFVQHGPNGDDVNQTGDTVLFHEMAHALHRTPGTLAGDATVDPVRDGADPMDTGIERDEYQATGLGRYWADPLTENQYREDRRYGLGDENIDYRRRYSPDGNYPGGPNYVPK